MDATNGRTSFAEPLAIGFGRHIRMWQTLTLLALGILAALLHATFRFPLHLPGHHGLEWMALLIIARRTSSYRWAASVAASGAAAISLLPALGFHDPLAPLVYLLPGICLDLLWPLVRARPAAALLALATAVAYVTIPLLHAGLWLSAGCPSGSLSHGLLFPVLTHLGFGFAGGGIGAGLWNATHRHT